MSLNKTGNYSKLIKEYAFSVGFDLCGIAQCKPLREHVERLRRWKNAGMNAGMSFLENNIELRTDPRLLLKDAKSIIVAGISYYSPAKQGGDGVPYISRYVYGNDYHAIINEKLHLLLEYILSLQPSASGKTYVDTGPVLEKAWAREAGLGWIGRHSILINKEIGSFMFLGEIILNIELQYDTPCSENNCNECRLCIETCPTGAINNDKTIDARKCISWLTIENKDPIPEEFLGQMKERIIGCDICQDVCPWNKKLKALNKDEFAISPELIKMNRSDWLTLSLEKYLELFSQSSVGRIKYERLVRNIRSVLNEKNNVGHNENLTRRPLF